MHPDDLPQPAESRHQRLTKYRDGLLDGRNEAYAKEKAAIKAGNPAAAQIFRDEAGEYTRRLKESFEPGFEPGGWSGPWRRPEPTGTDRSDPPVRRDEPFSRTDGDIDRRNDEVRRRAGLTLYERLTEWLRGGISYSLHRGQDGNFLSFFFWYLIAVLLALVNGIRIIENSVGTTLGSAWGYLSEPPRKRPPDKPPHDPPDG